MKPTFEYGYARVHDFAIDTLRDEQSGKTQVEQMSVHDEPVRPTKRFWHSFFLRFGISDNVFRYFDHAEVFARVSERAKNDQVRYCIERDKEGRGKLLAVSNPQRPIISHGEALNLIQRYEGSQIQYHNGIVNSTHTPRSGRGSFLIGGDEFQHRYVLDTPIDGFTQPRIHLSFLRLICTNGAVGYSRAFRSELNVGKDVSYCIARALDSYDNDDGYSALRQRFASAQTSWASLHECEQLYRLLARLANLDQVHDDQLMANFGRMTGNIHELYGLANINALSVKRQRVLPARCRVYDLLNFASEVATHRANESGNRALQAYLGQLIADEYDMEGTAEKTEDFKDFFLPSDDTQAPFSQN